MLKLMVLFSVPFQQSRAHNLKVKIEVFFFPVPVFQNQILGQIVKYSSLTERCVVSPEFMLLHFSPE